MFAAKKLPARDPWSVQIIGASASTQAPLSRSIQFQRRYRNPFRLLFGSAHKRGFTRIQVDSTLGLLIKLLIRSGHWI
jgi:hypothetical protein